CHGILAGWTVRIFQPVYWHHWFRNRDNHRHGYTFRCSICSVVVACNLDWSAAGHGLLLLALDPGRLRDQYIVPLLHDRLGGHHPGRHSGSSSKCIARFDQSHTTDEDDIDDGRLANDHPVLRGDRCIDSAALWRSNVLGHLWTKRNSIACPAPSSHIRM